jgi:hypothetical protein
LEDDLMRVNARLDAESQRQLEYLRETTGAGVSDVLKASLAHYYAAVSAARRPKLEHLRPWVGKSGSGRRDVSVRTKELLADSLAVKERVPGRGARPRRAARADG